MKITKTNYFKVIKDGGFESLPLVLKQSHSVIITKTDNGSDWSLYNKDKELKRMMDLTFKKLEEYIVSQKEDLSGVKDEDSPEVKQTRIDPYSKIDREVYFIEWFLEFHDTVMPKKKLGIFIDELHLAIEKQEIRKTSPVAKEIIEIQKAAVEKYNQMQSNAHYVLKPETIKKLKGIIAKHENSKEVITEKKEPKKKTITLNGIQEEAKPETLPGTEEPKLISSTDFANMEFKTIGFKDKWLSFIGDPCPGFKAGVFGMPKMGKSFLCVEFADYLGKNHGRVLYVTKEEFMSPTFQLKIKEKNAANSNLDIAGSLPQDLSPYQFIVLDSVTSMKLSVDDLKQLETKNPGKSFIYVFQVTKSGKARGTNEYMHNVDVLIDVPEKGKAVQNGRFNQGGELNIFPEKDEKLTSDNLPVPDNTSKLSGLNGNKNMKNKKTKIDRKPADTLRKIKVKEVYQEIQPKLKTLDRIIYLLSQAKYANWGNVSSLANIHSELGQRLVENYTEHEGYSKSLAEGMERHTSACKKLSKELSKRIDVLLKNDAIDDLYEWNNFLTDRIDSFEVMLQNEPVGKRLGRKLLRGAVNKELSIETELGVPLEILAGILLTKPMEDQIIDVINDKPEEAESAVKRLAEEFILEKNSPIKIKEVKFLENDPADVSGGASYYKVTLVGSKEDLEHVTGTEELFYYEWK